MNLEQYKKELEQLPKTDAIEIEIFLCQAARLASAGDDSLLRDWYDHPTSLDFLGYFGKRAKIGMWQLNNFTGEALAFSIIEAQDVNCLLSFDRKQESRLFFDHDEAELQKWIMEAEDCQIKLDDEAAELLAGYLNTFEINEEDRLVIIEYPLSATERTLISKLGKTKMLGHLQKLVVQGTKNTLDFRKHSKKIAEEFEAKGHQELRFGLAADDGDAPQKVRDTFKKRHTADGQTGVNEKISVTATIEDNWGIKLYFVLPEEWEDHISSITFGPLSLNATEEKHIWTTETLEKFSGEQKHSLIRRNSFIVRLASGRMFKF